MSRKPGLPTVGPGSWVGFDALGKPFIIRFNTNTGSWCAVGFDMARFTGDLLPVVHSVSAREPGAERLIVEYAEIPERDDAAR
jgi:hypothetical protein